MITTIVDSHAHLDWESYNEDREAVIDRAFSENVVQIVQAGVHLHKIPEMLALSDQFANIYSGVGLHPHEAKDWNADSADILRDACKNHKVVAIGECGLDFYYNHSERETQLKVFANQVDLARELQVPLIIHTRDAWQDTFDLLRKHGRGEVKGVFHCFTGGPEELPGVQSLDFYVSFSGIVTFPKATNIQAAVPGVADQRILVETDSPYLAPQGRRGKRNEPANIWITADKLAELRGVSRELIASQTSANARKLFGIPAPS